VQNENHSFTDEDQGHSVLSCNMSKYTS